METPFTCITCRLVFEDLPQQKSHYQTAWHCFNLKRKVAGLAPVTQEVFEEKVAALKGEGEQKTKKQYVLRHNPNSMIKHICITGRRPTQKSSTKYAKKRDGVSLRKMLQCLRRYKTFQKTTRRILRKPSLWWYQYSQISTNQWLTFIHWQENWGGVDCGALENSQSDSCYRISVW